MIKNRNIGISILLTLVTCGIYGIYWFIVLADETNNASGEQSGTSGGVAFLLTLVTCGIYGFYWAYKQGEKIDKALNERGIPSDSSAILYLVLCIVGLSIVAYALMQSKLNQISNA